MPTLRCGSIPSGALFSAGIFAFVALAAPGTGRAELRQIAITGTVDFAGCPESISCAAFPLMWGISSGETVSARFVYDDESPLALLDDQSPDYVSARYDHALPLAAPLGVEVHFGPYSALAGAEGAGAERYAIDLFDDLGSACCPDFSEGVAIEMTTPEFSFSLTAPPGFHDLDLRAVRLDFLNYSGIEDLLNGPALPPGFPGLGWEEVRLSVDVWDPVYARAGRAFLTVESLEVSDVAVVPALSGWGMVALVATLVAAGVRGAAAKPR